MRIGRLLVMLVAVPGAEAALAQREPAPPESAAAAAPQESPEEVVVRGRRLTDLRFEVEQAQERAYTIFNEINSDDDFDVYCREERKYHSRAKSRVCRAQFENRISAEAATEYMRSLSWNCPVAPGGEVNTQACMFSDVGQSAATAARGVESGLPTKHEQLNDEIVRLANEDDRFARAILDWYETNQQYENARKRRNGD